MICYKFANKTTLGLHKYLMHETDSNCTLWNVYVKSNWTDFSQTMG